MKVNKSGLYEHSEGEVLITDTETSEQLIFIMDQENGIVLRSMLEDDLKNVKAILHGTHRDRRRKFRELCNEIVKKGSEKKYFVAEKMADTGKEDKYEEERTLIGYGQRINRNISINVKEDDKGMSVLNLVKKLAKYLEIDGFAGLVPLR